MYCNIFVRTKYLAIALALYSADLESSLGNVCTDVLVSHRVYIRVLLDAGEWLKQIQIWQTQAKQEHEGFLWKKTHSIA
jgi:hypothetical protein